MQAGSCCLSRGEFQVSEVPKQNGHVQPSQCVIPRLWDIALEQRTVRLACVVHVRHLVFIPQHSLRGVEGQLIDDLCLEAPPLIGADHDLHEEVNTAGPGVIL